MANNRYVVLLRGVNVGGKNRVPKAEFQEVLERAGCTDVVIYLNSGNAVCTSEKALTSNHVQAALEKHFGFPIPTLVLPARAIRTIAAAIPLHWSNDPLTPDKSGQKSDVLYLFDDVNSPGILDELGYNAAIESMLYVDGAVLANITRVNQSRGSLQKLVGTKLYSRVTIRNIHTAKKLAELI